MNVPSDTVRARELGAALADRHYVETRQAPRAREGDYLILSDVRQVLEAHARDFGGDVFDYGCGGAPYADLFQACRRYIKADVLPGPVVDRLLGPDGMTGEPNASFDWVVSTQVLEHVPDPAAYLTECHRILRPGGELLLTTHGFFPEHGCPFDFHRWTGEGLVRAARAAGFEILSAGKLTSGVRGAVQMLHHCVWNLRPGSASHRAVALLLGMVRKAHGWFGVPVLNWLADRFRSQAIVPIDDPSALYIGLFLRARRQ